MPKNTSKPQAPTADGDWDASVDQTQPVAAMVVQPVAATATAPGVPAVAPAALPVEPAPQIPNTLAELLPLLTKLDNKPRSFANASRREDAQHNALLAEVRRRVFALQQGLPVLADIQHAQHVINADRATNGPAIRKARLDKLSAFLTQPEKRASAESLQGKPKLLIRLLTDASVQSELALCRALLAQVETFAIQNFSQAYPQSRMDEIQRELQSGPAPEKLAALQSECAAVEVALAHRSDLNVKGLIQQAYEPAMEAIRHLVALCVELLTTWQQEAEGSEREFFAVHDLPHEQTLVARQYEQFRATLPAPSQTALQWFGIQD